MRDIAKLITASLEKNLSEEHITKGGLVFMIADGYHNGDTLEIKNASDIAVPTIAKTAMGLFNQPSAQMASNNNPGLVRSASSPGITWR